MIMDAVDNAARNGQVPSMLACSDRATVLAASLTPSPTPRRWTRRDLLLFGAGAIAAVAAGGSLLPQTTLKRLGVIHENENWPKKEMASE